MTALGYVRRSKESRTRSVSLEDRAARLRLARAALYARVSTPGQTVDPQLHALRTYSDARGWEGKIFVDAGISGAQTRRPALDTLLAAARARQLDVVVCTKLDRLARSTHHLVTLVKELEVLGVDLARFMHERT